MIGNLIRWFSVHYGNLINYPIAWPQSRVFDSPINFADEVHELLNKSDADGRFELIFSEYDPSVLQKPHPNSRLQPRLRFYWAVSWYLAVGSPGSAALLIPSSLLLNYSLYIEFAWDHVTTAQLRDLASPIYGHIEAFTGFTWPRDQSRELISRGTDTRVCNGCNVCSITHPHSSGMWALPLCTAWWPWIRNSKIAQFYFDEFCTKMYVMQCFWGRWTRWKCPFPPKI